MNKAKDFLNTVLKEKSKLVIACSGGPDSMCLLDLALKLKKVKQLTIIVAHVNHNLRPESKTEQQFLQEYCEKNNLIFETIDLDFHDQFNEQKGHEERYNFFKKVIAKYGAKYLLTAHHADDLMETIFLRIARGSTLSGYLGFSKVKTYDSYQVIRPLWDYTKADILKYDEENNIFFFTDESNNSLAITRNRYRHQLLPFLKKEDPNIAQKYGKFSQELAAYDTFVNDYIIKLDCLKDNYLDLDKLAEESEFIKEKALRELIKKIQKDNWLEVSDALMQEIKKLFDGRNRSIDLNNEFIARREYHKLYIMNRPTKESFSYELTEDLTLPMGKFTFAENTLDESNYTLRLNSKEIALPLKVRGKRTGDKMAVKNLAGHKKIKDIFIDEKIPLAKRAEIPLVVDNNDVILWIPGVKKSKFAKTKKEKCDIIVQYKGLGEKE